MSKQLRLTPENIAEIRQEFEKALTGAISDGKINFVKSVPALQRRAELQFTELAWYKMQSLIRECDKEVGWHGVARRADEDGKDIYRIEDILVYPQEVTGVTVTPDQQQYQMWLMRHPDEVFNNIRMQGHSHVNMSTSPSGVDTTFYEQILRQLDDTMFYIFLIWNKRNERYVKIYDMAKNVLFETADVTVTVLPAENGIEEFLSAAKKMITERKPPVIQSYSGGNYTPPTTYTPPAVQNYTPVIPHTAPASGDKPTTGNALTSGSKPTSGAAPAAPADSGQKSGKKHRVKEPFKKSSAPDSTRSISDLPSWYKNHCDDDDPYGPFGYREYYGFD